MQEHNKESIQKLIEESCNLFNERDALLLSRDINERTITAQLKAYLNQKFPDYDVDVEYNRMFDPKRGEEVPKRLVGWPRKRVYPDIIIHKRNSYLENNLVVFEAKWRSRYPKINEREKVKAYMEEPSLQYKYGFIIEVTKGGIKAIQV